MLFGLEMANMDIADDRHRGARTFGWRWFPRQDNRRCRPCRPRSRWPAQRRPVPLWLPAGRTTSHASLFLGSTRRAAEVVTWLGRGRKMPRSETTTPIHEEQ